MSACDLTHGLGLRRGISLACVLRRRPASEARMIRMIGTLKGYGRYMHENTCSMHIGLFVCMFLLGLPPPQPPYKGGGLWPPPQRGRPPSVAAPLCGFLYMVAGEVASIAKTYRGMSKYALNMYFHAYISYIPLKSLSS